MRAEVLVVDDSADLRTFLASVLEDEGYTVLQASDGKPALERLRQHPTRLVVLLDLHMPVMDGFAVLRAVDADPSLSTCHAYVVMSSAQGNELADDFHQLVERLHVPVFSKPFDVSALLAAVTDAVERLKTGAPGEPEPTHKPLPGAGVLRE
jgi:CheY-like chemotaxis protein